VVKRQATVIAIVKGPVMSNGFDIEYKLLPPKLKLQLWVLALDANTSKVNIAYRRGAFRTSLAYNYGGNVQAALSRKRLTTTVGFHPGTHDISAGLVFRGFKFGTTANIGKSSVGAAFGYGSALLPFPAELSTTFNSGAAGLQSMAGTIRSARNNPLAWYNLHSDDVTAITKAVSAGQKIAKYGRSKDNFGIGLRLNYTPQTGFTIYGGAQFRF